jgi:DNA-binding PadR family transcriptional regulator
MTSQARVPVAPHIFEILLALSQGPRHGYGIIADIDERTGGEVSIGTSSLYAAVRQMLRDGLIEEAPPVTDEQSSGPPRRYYRITDTGREVAHLEADRLRRTAAAAEALLRAAQPETRS